MKIRSISFKKMLTGLFAVIFLAASFMSCDDLNRQKTKTENQGTTIPDANTGDFEPAATSVDMARNMASNAS